MSIGTILLIILILLLIGALPPGRISRFVGLFPKRHRTASSSSC